MVASAITLSPFVNAADAARDPILDVSEVIVVTGERPTPLEQTTTTWSISEEDIRELGAQSLDQILKNAPGVYVRTGGQGTPRVDIRGFKARHVIYLINGVPANGAEDGQFDPSVYLLSDPRVRYEFNDWIPVMATGTGGVAYLNPEDGAKFDGSANALQDVDLIFGSQGATGLDLVPLLAWKLLGMNVEPVFGIKGRGDGRLMFERGEATIDYQTSSGYLSGAADLVAAGTAVPMMTWGALDEEGAIVRDPTFPDMPSFKEVCAATEGCETEGVAWDAWKAFFIAGYPSQKIAFLPKGTPQEVIDTYVAAFEAVRSRPDFAEISSNEVGDYPMFVGEGAQNAADEATSVSPEAKAYVIDWLKESYGVTIK